MNPWLIALMAVASAPPLARRVDDPAGWYKGDVFYELYVRSFSDSNGDGHGDLHGLIGRLDALVELGVDGLWLMPIYAGPTKHGYGVMSYDVIDSRYGTMDDALALLAAAHERGLAVVLDYVPNHVSSSHPWFVMAEAGDRHAQAHFVWRDRRPEGWTVAWNPDEPGGVWSMSSVAERWYYHAFVPSMPDLDLRHPGTRASILAAAKRWIERGADGLRVDAVRYLFEDGPGLQADRPETFRFVEQLRQQLDPSGAFVVAEAWASTATAALYLGAADRDGASLVFDFSRAYAIDRALAGGPAADLERTVRESERAVVAGGGFAPFATNHDCVVPRAGIRGPDAAVLSAALVVTSGGVPFLWQGDELGLPAIDEDQIRRPMRWAPGPGAGFTAGTPWRHIGGRQDGDDVRSQRADPKSVWRRVQQLLRTRRASPALRFGVRYPVPVAGSPNVWAYLRHDGVDRALVVANLGERAARATLDLRALPVPASGSLDAAYGTGTPLAVRRGRASVKLPPRAVFVFSTDHRPDRWTVRFGRPGIVPSRDVAVDQGLRFDRARGIGFSQDATRQVHCARAQDGDHSRCAIRLAVETGYAEDLRWMAALPNGPYTVRVELIGRGGRGQTLRVEGEAMHGKGRILSRAVLVRDGRLSLRPVPRSDGGSPVEVAAITIAKARYRRANNVSVEVAEDRLTLRARRPGTVEWRMDHSSVEPVDQTPLVKTKHGRWEATLGPWPKGSVSEVSWVIRTPDDDFLTAGGGQEHTTKIRP